MKKNGRSNLNMSVDIQNVSKIRIPPHRLLKTAAVLVLSSVLKNVKNGIICIRIVDEAESAMLNQQYRQKSGPTNVLAFPVDVNELGLLGDLAICAAVVKQEALAQGKTFVAHFSHMVVHGTLHLLGFDHQTDRQALEMESLEIKFLQQLGFANPYSI